MVNIGYATKAKHPLNNADRLKEINKEFKAGYKLLETIGKSVTIFGSAKTKPNQAEYVEARELGKWLAESGYTIVTGGGPGIMAAANRGAVDGGGRSIGFNIMLPGERELKNRWVQEYVAFYYFHIRKVMLASAAHAYVYYPGGFGTMDEFFEITTLIETHKMHRDVPIILVGKGFWEPLIDWMKKIQGQKYKTIDTKHFKMWHIVDNAEEAYEIITGCEAGKKICPWTPTNTNPHLKA